MQDAARGISAQLELHIDSNITQTQHQTTIKQHSRNIQTLNCHQHNHTHSVRPDMTRQPSKPQH